jgi:hypothetical protein
MAKASGPDLRKYMEKKLSSKKFRRSSSGAPRFSPSFRLQKLCAFLPTRTDPAGPPKGSGGAAVRATARSAAPRSAPADTH